MGLIKCSNCGKGTLNTFKECPFCGAKLQGEQKQNESNNSDNNSTNIVGIIISIIIIAISLFFIFNGTSKLLSNDNSIKYDKSNDTYTVTLWETEQ